MHSSDDNDDGITFVTEPGFCTPEEISARTNTAKIDHASDASVETYRAIKNKLICVQSMDGIDEDFFTQFQFSIGETITMAEFRSIFNLLCVVIERLGKRPFSLKSSETNYLVGACTRRGNAPIVLERKNSNVSEKCDCKAQFKLYLDGRFKWINQQHATECKSLTLIQIENNSRSFRKALSPTKLDAVEDAATAQYANSTASTSQIVRDTIRKTLKSSGIIGDLTCFRDAPAWYYRDVTSKAKFAANGSVSKEESVNELITFLKESDMEYSVIPVEVNSCSGDVVVTMVAWMDPQIAPTEVKDVLVITSDVTFGLCSVAFPKYSQWSNLTASHEVQVLLSSLITHENTFTFEKEIELLLKKYPYLAMIAFVLIVDGDRAKWLAARRLFQQVILIVCIYHQSENIKAHFGPLVKQGAKQNRSQLPISSSSSSSSSVQISSLEESETKDHWIECCSCKKWRKLPVDTDFTSLPIDFFCGQLCELNFFQNMFFSDVIEH